MKITDIPTMEFRVGKPGAPEPRRVHFWLEPSDKKDTVYLRAILAGGADVQMSQNLLVIGQREDKFFFELQGLYNRDLCETLGVDVGQAVEPTYGQIKTSVEQVEHRKSTIPALIAEQDPIIRHLFRELEVGMDDPVDAFRAGFSVEPMKYIYSNYAYQKVHHDSGGSYLVTISKIEAPLISKAVH